MAQSLLRIKTPAATIRTMVSEEIIKSAIIQPFPHSQSSLKKKPF